MTEKGYRHDPTTGGLRTDDPEVAADLAGAPPVTPVGQLVQGLARRHARPARRSACCPATTCRATAPCCARLVLDGCARLPGGDALAAWVERGGRASPSSMVDRVVPAPTDADRAEVADLLGMVDAGAVAAEPFRQWVVQDAFRAGRPAWERAGALLVDDVAPYEAVKLRLLNGSHSALAYLGALAGYEHVADAVADPGLAAFVGQPHVRGGRADAAGPAGPGPGRLPAAAAGAVGRAGGPAPAAADRGGRHRRSCPSG